MTFWATALGSLCNVLRQVQAAEVRSQVTALGVGACSGQHLSSAPKCLGDELCSEPLAGQSWPIGGNLLQKVVLGPQLEASSDFTSEGQMFSLQLMLCIVRSCVFRQYPTALQPAYHCPRCLGCTGSVECGPLVRLASQDGTVFTSV